MNQIKSETQISHQLIGWSILSILMGGFFFVFRRQFLSGVGTQFIAWGAINGAIGWISMQGSKNPQVHMKNNPEIEHYSRKSKLVNFLRLNALLDIFYILGGVRLMQTKGKINGFWLGQGVGIVLQGLFLFLFDIFHSSRLSR